MFVRGNHGWFHLVAGYDSVRRAETACGTKVEVWDVRATVGTALTCPKCRKLTLKPDDLPEPDPEESAALAAKYPKAITRYLSGLSPEMRIALGL